MPTITGTVEKIENANGWYNIFLAGKKYSTKSKKVVGDLTSGDSITAEFAETQNTKDDKTYTNYYLTSWAPAIPVSTPPREAQRGNVPPDVFEARDRRIAMEASYGSAARFMQALAAAGHADAVNGANYVTLARTTYADVLKAGRGDPFMARKAAEPPYDPDEVPV